MHRKLWLITGIVLLAVWMWSQRPHERTSAPMSAPAIVTADAPRLPPPRGDANDVRVPDFLPPQAHAVLQQIARGGPYEYRQDGGVFGNRERRLPAQPRGYYREYTVETPGSRDRGARRIITGGSISGQSRPREYWYSDDHYRSFRRFELSAEVAR